MSSPLDLTDIVKDRAQVNALLRKSAISNNSTRINSNAWVSPHEKHLPVFKYDSLDDPNKVASLVALHSDIFQHRKVAPYKVPKLLVSFETAEIPDSTPPRPSLDEVQGMVESGFLNVAIYSTEGYNYTLEYVHVYNGETTPGALYFYIHV